MEVRHRTDSPWRTWSSVPELCCAEARSHYQPGAPPQRSEKPQTLALKARFTSGRVWRMIGAIPQSLSKVIVHITLARRTASPSSIQTCGCACTRI